MKKWLILVEEYGPFEFKMVHFGNKIAYFGLKHFPESKNGRFRSKNGWIWSKMVYNGSSWSIFRQIFGIYHALTPTSDLQRPFCQGRGQPLL